MTTVTGASTGDEQGVTVRPGLTIPEHELGERFVRSGGPGGQHVNTSATKVELRFDVAGSSALTEQQRAGVYRSLGSRLTGEGVLVLTASEHRSQARNREAVRGRLATLLREALAPRRERRPTRRPRSAEQRRLAAKRRRGDLKQQRRPPAPE